MNWDVSFHMELEHHVLFLTELRALVLSSPFVRQTSLRVVVLLMLILYVLFVPKNQKRTECV